MMKENVELANTDALARLEKQKRKKKRIWIIWIGVLIVLGLVLWICSKFPTKKDMLVYFMDQKQVEYLEIDHPEIDDEHRVWFAAYGVGAMDYTSGEGYKKIPIIEIVIRGPEDMLFGNFLPKVYLDGEEKAFSGISKSGGYWTGQYAIVLSDVPKDWEVVTMDFDGTLIKLTRKAK